MIYSLKVSEHWKVVNHHGSILSINVCVEHIGRLFVGEG